MICDVSGFVRQANLHHQLHGPKVGAEKTRLWLDSVFEVLLQTVADHQGEVLQFIGDAVVARFPIEKAIEAARCTLLIKARCSQIQVQIKTAITAGAYDLYQTLNPGQYPLTTVLGPAVERALQALQQAKESDVICDESFLMHCQPDANAIAAQALAMGFYRLVPIAHRAPPAGHLPTTPSHDLEALNEIKLLTIVYVQVDLPETQRLKSHWLDSLCKVLQGESLDQTASLIGLCQTPTGHRFQYIMGSTQSQFNDVEMAIQMTMHIRELIEEQGCNLRASIGYGHAWQGKLGGRQLKLFNAHGREINLAARILEKAEAGQIVLTESAAQQLNDQLHVVEQGQLSIKGEEQLIRIYRLPLQHEIKSPALRKSNVLHGRAYELNKVLEILTAPNPTRAPRLIQITGAAGIGKSTFVGAIEQSLHLQQSKTFTLRSSPHSKLLPYSIAYPLLLELGKLYPEQNLEDWIVDTLNPHEELAEWVGTIGLISPLKVPGLEQAQLASPELKSQAIKKIFTVLVSRASSDFNLHCVVEDLQWFDNASIDLVTQALFKSPGLNCLYTIRTSENNLKTTQLLDRLDQIQPATPRVHLLPFNQAETEQFLLKWFSVHAVPLPLVYALHQLSEGNLLLICALIQSLLQDGTVRKVVVGELVVDFRKLEQFISLPTNMEHALQARMDTLPKTHRTVLSHCSIFKTAFSASELQAAFEYPNLMWLEQIFQELEQQKFIRSFVTVTGETRQTFEHQVIEQCVYERIPFEERRALHARFADWLEYQIDLPEVADRNRLTIQLAAQYDWAGLLEKALPLTQDAIRFAFAVGALDEALERLDKLIEWHRKGILPHSSRLDLAQLYEKKAHLCYAQGGFDDAIAQNLKALETLGLTLNTSLPWLRQRNYLMLQMLYLKRYVPGFLRRRAKKPDAQASLIVRVCTNLGELGFVMGRTHEGNVHLLHAVKMVGQYELTTGDQATAYGGCVILAQIYNKRWMSFFKSLLYQSLEKLPEGHEKLKAMAHINHRMGYLEYTEGHFDQAFQLAQQAGECARLSHEFQTEVMAFQVFIFIRVAQGRFAEALDYYDTYEALAKKYSTKYFNVLHQYALVNQRIYCLALEGRLQEARTHLQFLEKIPREFKVPQHFSVPVQRCKLMVLYQERDWPAARSQALHLAGLLNDEIMNKGYFFTCFSLPVEVLLEADQHHHPLDNEEVKTVQELLKQLKRIQMLFELPKPTYLLLDAQWMLRQGKSKTLATRQLHQALDIATRTGQQAEIKKANQLLDSLTPRLTPGAQ